MFRGRTARVFAYVAASATALFLAATPAFAGLFFTAEVREAYEDNVSGLSSDSTSTFSLQKQGDFSTELFAELGYSYRVAGGTTLIARASAQHDEYARFGEFDFTVMRVSAGVRQRLTDVFSARLMLNGKAKNYDNPLKDGTSVGATMVLREQFGRSFWLSQFYEFERNKADSTLYRYNGHSVRVRAGYDVTNALLVSAGYSYLRREYDDPAFFRVISHTVSADLTIYLGKRWSIIPAYDFETTEENFFDTVSTNNIYSVGIQYAY